MKALVRTSVLTAIAALILAPDANAIGGGTGTSGSVPGSTTGSDIGSVTGTTSTRGGEVDGDTLKGTTTGTTSGTTTTSPASSGQSPATSPASKSPVTPPNTTSGGTISGDVMSDTTSSSASGPGSMSGTAPQATTAASSAAADIGTRYQVIDFKKGAASLSLADQRKLQTLIQNSKAKGEIDKVHVAVWSDKPFKGTTDLPKRDRDLAKARIEKVENHLEDKLAVSVEAHSLAERSDWLARNLNTTDAQLKSEVASKGAAPIANEDLALIQQMGGPGKAVIVVSMKDSAQENTQSGSIDSPASGTGTRSGVTSSGSTTSDNNTGTVNRQSSPGNPTNQNSPSSGWPSDRR